MNKPTFPSLNETGASAVKVIAITLIMIMLIGGGASVFFTIKDNSIEFTEEETAKASEMAQSVFAEVSTVASTTPIDDYVDALQSIGYEETKREQSTIIYEKKNELSDYYVLLQLKPHETYANLSRANVQVFDKENRVMITQLENVLTWQKSE